MKYDKLVKNNDYDREVVEQLAELVEEITAKESELKNLTKLADQHKKLYKYVWKTLDGKVIALHKIEDDHLKNIMFHLLKNGKSIPIEIEREALSRQMVIPDSRPNERKLLEYYEDEYDIWDD